MKANLAAIARAHFARQTYYNGPRVDNGPAGLKLVEERAMAFSELVKAALELGVIPALALFLVVAMFLQNKQLMEDRRAMEKQLLETLQKVMSDYKRVVDAGQAPRSKK